MSVQEQPETQYSLISTAALWDKSLSFRARGVLALVLSAPEGFRPTLTWLADQATGEGAVTIQRALNELTAKGYRTFLGISPVSWTDTPKIPSI